MTIEIWQPGGYKLTVNKDQTYQYYSGRDLHILDSRDKREGFVLTIHQDGDENSAVSRSFTPNRSYLQLPGGVIAVPK